MFYMLEILIKCNFSLQTFFCNAFFQDVLYIKDTHNILFGSGDSFKSYYVYRWDL